MPDKYSIQKPFLKWVGGKTQIIHSILNIFPNEIDNYHEIFLGGGSVLFAVLSLQKQNIITIKNKIYAYDINKHLINVYKQIQTNKDELFRYLQHYLREFESIEGTEINRKPKTIEEAKTSRESYYYWIRDKYNHFDNNTDELDKLAEFAALFIFINKTCFRGMYREGPNGYNVPYGHYKKIPKFMTYQDLSSISELIQNVVFEDATFTKSLQLINQNQSQGQNHDFVYLDPPYVPENSKSFVGYVSDGFNFKTHLKLFNDIKKLNVKFVMSNSNVDLVQKQFPLDTFKHEKIIARRAIHSKKPESKTTELLISNF